ncbi:hypothetical protein SAMN05443663_110106 [Flavobacterium defluvii]|uniref:Uncharacterized protein n=1 Tax=Flavobacterium defluvii TaxID=370979 RepID=A0A1M5VBQ5_9FLAO|nr:hypothetical protein SAMN05443663_110106 [Flavobacterium defluvii]
MNQLLNEISENDLIFMVVALIYGFIIIIRKK